MIKSLLSVGWSVARSQNLWLSSEALGSRPLLLLRRPLLLELIVPLALALALVLAVALATIRPLLICSGRPSILLCGSSAQRVLSRTIPLAMLLGNVLRHLMLMMLTLLNLQIAHFRTACHFELPRGADHATWEHRADARDFVGAREGTARIDAEARFIVLTASCRHDDVIGAIDTYATDVGFVLLLDRLAHSLLGIQADARANILTTKTLRKLEHEATHIAAARSDHSDLGKGRITQVCYSLLRLSNHTLLC